MNLIQSLFSNRFISCKIIKSSMRMTNIFVSFLLFRSSRFSFTIWLTDISSFPHFYPFFFNQLYSFYSLSTYSIFSLEIFSLHFYTLFSIRHSLSSPRYYFRSSHLPIKHLRLKWICFSLFVRRFFFTSDFFHYQYNGAVQ